MTSKLWVSNFGTSY